MKHSGYLNINKLNIKIIETSNFNFNRSNDALGGILSHLPFLRFIIPELSGYNNLMTTLDKLWRFIDDEIEHQSYLLKINKKPDNLIQAFINESGESFDSKYKIFNFNLNID